VPRSRPLEGFLSLTVIASSGYVFVFLIPLLYSCIWDDSGMISTGKLCCTKFVQAMRHEVDGLQKKKLFKIVPWAPTQQYQ
jgi:hypothetical protein